MTQPHSLADDCARVILLAVLYLIIHPQWACTLILGCVTMAVFVTAII